MTGEGQRGAAAGALITACAAAALLWVDGWYVVVSAALHTHDIRAILAAVAGVWLVHALLVFVGFVVANANGRTKGRPKASASCHTRLAFLLKGILSTADSTPAAELADRLTTAALEFMAYEKTREPVGN